MINHYHTTGKENGGFLILLLIYTAIVKRKFAMTVSSIDTYISSLDIIIFFSELDCHVLLPKRKYYFLIKYSVIREIYSHERRI